MFVVRPVVGLPLPLSWEVTSEEVPAISIRLEKRTPKGLGVLVQNDKPLGGLLPAIRSSADKQPGLFH